MFDCYECLWNVNCVFAVAYLLLAFTASFYMYCGSRAPLVSKQTKFAWNKIEQRFYRWRSTKHALCFVERQPIFVCLGKGARVPDYFNYCLEILLNNSPLDESGMCLAVNSVIISIQDIGVEHKVDCLLCPQSPSYRR